MGARIAAIAATVIVVVAGVWIAGLLSPNVYVHGAIAAAFVLLVIGAGWKVPRDRATRRAVVGAAVATGVVLVAVGGVLSMPKTADEQVPVAGKGGATLAASGSFESLAHETKGTARVVETADGPRLTLTGFSTDPGPDLRVIVVPGDPKEDGDVKDYLDLGKLKGTSGDQSYRLPKEFDAGRHDTVYVWCRAFTVGFGRARLE